MCPSGYVRNKTWQGTLSNNTNQQQLAHLYEWIFDSLRHTGSCTHIPQGKDLSETIRRLDIYFLTCNWFLTQL